MHPTESNAALKERANPHPAPESERQNPDITAAEGSPANGEKEGSSGRRRRRRRGRGRRGGGAQPGEAPQGGEETQAASAPLPAGDTPAPAATGEGVAEARGEALANGADGARKERRQEPRRDGRGEQQGANGRDRQRAQQNKANTKGAGRERGKERQRDNRDNRGKPPPEDRVRRTWRNDRDRKDLRPGQAQATSPSLWAGWNAARFGNGESEPTEN